jgi:bifunctional DNA-binding transcriptional regulator/antitoxin component of YhaV-PrlF toxin-antitoxin module
MAVVKMRGRGQVTIPQSLRKDLHLDDETMLTVVKAGNVLLMTPRPLQVDRMAKVAQQVLKKQGLRVDDVLEDLRHQRVRYNKERYGS